MEKTEIAKRNELQHQKMTKTPIRKLIPQLAVPTMISMVITAVYNTADTYFVSQLDDTSATGAVSVVFALMALLQAVSFMIGMGSGSWISRLLGKKDEKTANEVAISGATMSVIFGTLMLVVCKMFIKPLLYLLGATDTIYPYAKAYATYVLYAAPVMALSFVLNNMLRSEGKAKYSMFGIASGSILNIFLDPFFILPWGLNLGTAGAALATAISQSVGCIILLMPYILRKTTVRLRFSNLSRTITLYFSILKNGLPSFLRQGLASISTVVLNYSAAHYAMEASDAAIAAMGIVGKSFMLIFSLILGFGQGYQPVAGYNYGAKKYDRVKEAFFFTLKVTTVIMTTVAAIFFFIAPDYIALFSKNEMDENVLKIGTVAFRAQCLSMPLVPMGMVCNMTFQSIGKSSISSFLSSCRQGVYFIPLMIILPMVFGLFGVQITQSIADVLTFITCVPFSVYFIRQIGKTKKDSNSYSTN